MKYKFKMSDYGFVTDCKSGYMEGGKKVNYKWYNVWCRMIHRCYNLKDEKYGAYGMRGVKVSNEFKVASVFRDFYISNNPNGDLQMDKDLKFNGMYSRESIAFMSMKDNMLLQGIQRRDKKRLWGDVLFNKELDLKPIEKPKKERKVIELHPKDYIKYYETTHVRKDHFKRACRIHGWRFEDFEGVDKIECMNGDRKNYKYRYIKVVG